MNTSLTASVSQTIQELPDVVNNLLLLLSDKEKIVVTRRFNLNNAPKATLEEIGREFSVTRERVRQIEKNALSKMKRNVFNTALKHLHDYSLLSVRKHGGLLKEEALVADLKAISPIDKDIDLGSIHLSFVLHEDLDCIGNTITFHPYIREKEISDYSLKNASNKVVNQLNKYGNVKSLDKIHRDLKDLFDEMGFDVEKMRSLVEIDKRVALLDNDLVGLLAWRHINPRTLRDKILYILRLEKKPKHFSDIAGRISGANFDRRPVNLQAVHNELIRHEQFILIGRGIYALKEWGYEKGTVSAVIEKVLKECGELSQDEIIAKVFEQRQVKKITIVLALKNNDKFERVGRKRYRLIKK